ncbi:MAG: pyrroline-5-carboxylate reductase [Sediminibacterium sp.]|nr:pyrroline-5-carboxylate reductase [Sediminibacterium sp.]
MSNLFKNKKIAIIGCGNLGSTMASGLLLSKIIQPQQLILTRKNVQHLTHFKNQGVMVTSDNLLALKQANYVILGIKPYQVDTVLQGWKSQIKKQIIISFISNVSIAKLKNWVKPQTPIFRAMPNLALAIRESMTFLCGENYSAEQKLEIETLFNELGQTLFIEENLMEAATVVGSCGIAFALRFLRAKVQGAIDIGFSAKIALEVVAQTMVGAAKLIQSSSQHPEDVIDQVTTPKGCTIAGLNEMEYMGFSSSLIKGIKASYDKLQLVK